jgi:hypothetical protein
VADHQRLSLRAVNRATLDRQLLLRRHEMPARQAVRHLGGLQAQAPLAPYVGLWTRLAGFTTDELSRLLSERTVVRAPVMRATVHLADAADFVAFRPLFGPLLAAGLRANCARTLTGVDLSRRSWISGIGVPPSCIRAGTVPGHPQVHADGLNTDITRRRRRAPGIRCRGQRLPWP